MTPSNNTLNHLSSDYRDKIAEKLEKFFLFFKDSTYSFTPVSYSVHSFSWTNKSPFYSLYTLYYAKPAIWFSSFNQELTGTASDRYLSLPHRYVLTHNRIRVDSSNDLFYDYYSIISDFISFRKNDEKIYQFVSPLPLPNHQYMRVCTNYIIGNQLEYDLFDYYEDAFSHFVYSKYNSDYFNHCLHCTKSGYLLMKYLQFDDPDISSENYSKDIGYFISHAKKSKSYAQYAESAKSSARYMNLWDNIKKYDQILDAWETTPTIWSDIPESEYRHNSLRSMNLYPRSLLNSSEVRDQNLLPFLVSPLMYNLDDLLSTLYA